MSWWRVAQPAGWCLFDEAPLLAAASSWFWPLRVGLWRAAEGFSAQVAELRSLMPELDATDLAVAGHAVALSQWHVVCLAAMSLSLVHSCSFNVVRTQLQLHYAGMYIMPHCGGVGV